MSQFRNLIFEGGGVKGIAYAGAITELSARGVLKDVRRVGGTSAGAITAALVAAGADGDYVARAVGGTKFRKFMDDSFGVIRDTQRLLSQFGWYAGDAFSAWIQKQMYALSDKPNLTFGQLLELRKADPARFKELYVVGTNLSSNIPVIFSAEDTPDEPVWRAVRISMSIPLFFASVRAEPLRQVMVDGGVSWNYPVDLFDDARYTQDNPAAGQPVNYPTVYAATQVYNKETLGFRVDTRDEIKAEKEGWRAPPADINDFFDYIKALFGFMIDMANKAHLHTNDWHRTVFIDAEGVGTTEFDISEQKVETLIANGRKGVTDYFKWWDATPGAMNKI